MKKHYLVDTNVIIDMLLDREKDFKDSSLEVVDSIEFLHSK